jgi:hypothetical protein
MAAIGLPQTISFIAALRRRDTMPTSRHVGSALCVGAMSVCIAATVLGIIRLRPQLVAAGGELKGDRETDLFAAGQVVDGVYSNGAVGVVIRLPKNWHEMSLNAIRRAKRSGASAAASGDEQRAEQLAAKRPGNYPLFAVRRYPESFTGYNPSLVFNAYDKRALAATGLHNLQDYVNNFARVGGPYHVLSGPSRERLGSNDCYHVHVEGRFPSATVQQHVYATEREWVYLVLIASVIDEHDLSELQEALSTLRVTEIR